MRVFVESQARFVVHLRLQDVVEALQVSAPEMEAALDQLCDLGHLEKALDPAPIRTAEDFYKPRSVFRITPRGEAAERALAIVDEDPGVAAEPDSTALSDIRAALDELRGALQQQQPEKVRWTMSLLRTRFEDLTISSQILIRRLECATSGDEVEARQLIDYSEKFVSELALFTDLIAKTIRDIEATGFESTAVWARLHQWFIAKPGQPSNAELLRERLRTAIPQLLSAITRVNDRQLNRIDRSSDFRILARWFSEAASDAEAHRLWRTAFGLCSARHLAINDRTLDDYEAQDVPPHTSWLDAPPLRISLRPHGYGLHAPTSSLSRIVDRTAEKQKLAAATHEEALRILHAQQRFGCGRRMRLSELEHLEPDEFDLFLDLVGEAVSARVFADEGVEVLSADGSLRIRLEPTRDSREAFVVTADGVFSGPDHWISIEPLSNDLAEVAP